jgi:hypothetical protein
MGPDAKAAVTALTEALMDDVLMFDASQALAPSGLTPSLRFPLCSRSSTKGERRDILSGILSGWANSTTYVAVYDFTDMDVTFTDIDVLVSGAKDANGDDQQSDQGDTAVFSIETL